MPLFGRARAERTPPQRGLRSVDGYLVRIRARAAFMHGLRSLVGTVGAAAFVFALAAMALGPLGDAGWAALGWSLVALTVVGVGVWAWRAFSPLRGVGITRLLKDLDPALPSAAKSAFELGASPPPEASRAMIEAHRDRVRRSLAALPAKRVVKWRWLRHPAMGLGALGLLCALGALSSERGSAGAYALIHPGERDAEGERVAVAFADVEAHVIYPSYLAREADSVLDPTVLEVPRGTSIELRARPGLEASAAALRVDDRDQEMERGQDGRFFARFVVREDATLTLRLRTADGDWIVDAVGRSVHALIDEAPAIELLEPSESIVLEEPREIPFSWEVTDDIGVASVDLVLRTVDGIETRRRTDDYAEAQRPSLAQGAATVDPTLLAMQPGDEVTVWIEARDGDVVNGPNLGRSSQITITLASEATLRERRLATLLELLDQSLSLLADRLERDVPAEEEPARARWTAMEAESTAFVDALRSYAEEIRGDEGSRATDVALYRSMANRVRRLTHEERMAHPARLASHDRRTQIDARAVEELEDDTLTLDDLLGRARVADAAEIARELESIRREIRSLLSELRRAETPEARQQLLAAIGRAQARMRELAGRIAQMGTSVPQEFMNASEQAAQEGQNSLTAMREAVQRGDLESAERLATELQHQIDAMARALGDTESAIAESRFGPRERAMANAMESLADLEGEQQSLSSRGTERRGRAAESALESIGGQDNAVGRRLAERSDAIRDALDEVGRDRLSGFEQDVYDAARQRLIDTRDALRAGDLGEARRMGRAAADNLGELSRDLDLSALMFPGHEGETGADARRARAADDSLRELRRELDEALPDMSSHVQPRDQGQMRSDAERQAEARQATERLAEAFAEGPDGSPLDDDAPRELRDAANDMEGAARALEAGDPLESARLQEEAAARITDLRERLENQQQSGGGGGGESGQDDESRRPVVIPDADAFEGPMEMRRRLLDAMREGAPSGYEDSVRRYYEGLLR
ncbi:MAG: DUF4175 family protein [Sandaracinaceae bacterium]